MIKIYISSTFKDLIRHRKVVSDALRTLGHHVVAMEDYVAHDERPLDRCLADVDTCDIYLGIFAWRYGSVPPADNPGKRSVTELEYRRAVEKQRPRLIFLLHDDVQWKRRFDDKITEENDPARIKDLRKELQDERLVSFFKSPQQLAKLAVTAVSIELGPAVKEPTSNDRWPKLSDFDLDSLVRQAMKVVLGAPKNQCLIGLGLPCESQFVLKSFCERLQYKLGGEAEIQESISLKPTLMTVDRAVAVFKRYQRLLKYTNVVCPVTIPSSVAGASDPIGARFWRQLVIEYAGGYARRLIVVMASEPDSLFPDVVVRLDPPHFEEVDFHEWIVAIVRRMKWDEDFIDDWRCALIAECTDQGELLVDCVYLHLGDTLEMVNKSNELVDFQKAFRERSEHLDQAPCR